MTSKPETSRREADAPKQTVKWDNVHHFEERVLEAKDVKALGAETGKRLVWNRANNWTVPREDVPLTDDQMAALLDADDRFKVEG